MEKILRHRNLQGKIEYLIQWKNKPLDQATWAGDADIDSAELVETYWAQKDANESSLLAKFTPMASSFITFIVTLLLLFSSVMGQTIKGEFTVCDTQTKSLIDTHSLCKQWDSPSPEVTAEYTVYARRQNQIDGIAWMCRKTRIVITTRMTTFGYKKIISRSEQPVRINKEECVYMMTTLRCDRDDVLTCANKKCKSQNEPFPEYWWLSTRDFYRDNCFVEEISLKSPALNDVLFIGETAPCYANNFECQLDDRIVIWDRSILHECTVSKVATEKFVE
jgi:hypothetical protein